MIKINTINHHCNSLILYGIERPSQHLIQYPGSFLRKRYEQSLQRLSSGLVGISIRINTITSTERIGKGAGSSSVTRNNKILNPERKTPWCRIFHLAIRDDLESQMDISGKEVVPIGWSWMWAIKTCINRSLPPGYCY